MPACAFDWAALKATASHYGTRHTGRCLRSSSTARTATASFCGEAWHHASLRLLLGSTHGDCQSIRHAAHRPLPEVVVDGDDSDDVILRRGLASCQAAPSTEQRSRRLQVNTARGAQAAACGRRRYSAARPGIMPACAFDWAALTETASQYGMRQYGTRHACRCLRSSSTAMTVSTAMTATSSLSGEAYMACL